MPRYRLDLSYVGAAFNGWQSQADGSGVQDAVEKALATFLRHPVRIVGASRTDTGVHAEGQVACFESDAPYDERRWIRALHGLMPDGIGVRALGPVAMEFHPILASVGKAYRYRIWIGEGRLPQVAPFVWEGHQTLSLAAMRAGAAALVGRHDFSSFCASDSGAKTRVRTIFELELFEAGPLLDVWVVGDGFLKQMVRSIVGTLVEVGRGALAPADVAQILAARDRNEAGATAPARGLSLVEVFYERVVPVAALRQAAAAGFTLRTR
jgi:tRNA pseudouridine38-40 synthase